MDIFSLGVLRRVVSELPPPQPFFLNSFFGQEQTETTDEIHFDVDSGRRRLAPFVAPIVAGQVVAQNGYKTQTFKPAYIKDKRVFDGSRAFKRAKGERIGGGDISPEQRMVAALKAEMIDQVDMLTRRMEAMAAETLRTGKIIVSGELYPTVEVDFGRDSSLTKALTLGARWGESGVDPLDDVQAWSLLVTEKSGAAANTVVMDVKAWKLFSASPKVEKLLDRFRGADKLNPTVVGAGGRYMGNIGDFDIWVHADQYENPANGQLTPYLPDHTVIITGPDLEGVRVFGAIRDEEAGFQALPYFSKSWVEKDPAVRYLMMQSAPLLVPYRVNASLCATVR